MKLLAILLLGLLRYVGVVDCCLQPTDTTRGGRIVSRRSYSSSWISCSGPDIKDSVLRNTYTFPLSFPSRSADVDDCWIPAEASWDPADLLRPFLEVEEVDDEPSLLEGISMSTSSSAISAVVLSSGM